MAQAGKPLSLPSMHPESRYQWSKMHLSFLFIGRRLNAFVGWPFTYLRVRVSEIGHGGHGGHITNDHPDSSYSSSLSAFFVVQAIFTINKEG